MPPQCCMDVKEQYRGRPSVSRSRDLALLLASCSWQATFGQRCDSGVPLVCVPVGGSNKELAYY